MALDFSECDEVPIKRQPGDTLRPAEIDSTMLRLYLIVRVFARGPDTDPVIMTDSCGGAGQLYAVC
jgi:hypothetical protein